MNFEQFKNMLNYGRKLKLKIATIEDNIQEQRVKLTYKSNSSQAIAGSSSNHFEKNIDKIFYMEDKLSRYKKELQHHQDCITSIIKLDIFTYAESEVIRLRYLENENWEDISDYMNWDYQSRYVYKVHSKAIKKIFSNNLYT